MKNTKEKLKGLDIEIDFDMSKENPIQNMYLNLIEFFNNLHKITPFRDLKQFLKLIDDICNRASDEIYNTKKRHTPIFDYFDEDSITLYRSFGKYILTNEESNFDKCFCPEINKFKFEQFKNGTHDIFINPKVPEGISDSSVLKKFLDEYLKRHKTSKTCGEDEEGDENDLPF